MAMGGRRMKDPMAIDKKLIDQLLTDYKKPEDIIGKNGLLKQLTKAVLERALEAEMTEHLGYEKHDPAGQHPGDAMADGPPDGIPVLQQRTGSSAFYCPACR
jgi:Transposase, Mutator family